MQLECVLTNVLRSKISPAAEGVVEELEVLVWTQTREQCIAIMNRYTAAARIQSSKHADRVDQGLKGSLRSMIHEAFLPHFCES